VYALRIVSVRNLASQERAASAAEQRVAQSPELGRQQAAPAPRLSEGIELLGEREGYGFKEPVYLARRADRQYLRLSRLLYLVAAEADGQKNYEQIAPRVSNEFGRTVSADNVRFLVEEQLRPLGVLAAPDGTTPTLPRAKPVLALTWRVPILPDRGVGALAVVFRSLFFAPVMIAVLAGAVVLN
jgi:putative peptide zinc metalloprotease protein